MLFALKELMPYHWWLIVTERLWAERERTPESKNDDILIGSAFGL
jgi:hypothetical protein